MKNFFRELVSDENQINEKSFVGIVAFGMMVITLITDIVTGVLGRHMPIHEFVFEGFLVITLGAFGIAEAGKIFGQRKGGSSGSNPTPSSTASTEEEELG
jgi:hypothetical protein